MYNQGAIPFNIYIGLITGSLIESVVDLMNRLPYKGGVFDTLSTSIIVEGRPKVDMGHKNISFGSYAMVHIGTTNSI